MKVKIGKTKYERQTIKEKGRVKVERKTQDIGYIK
jgi:hypothetical protein